MFVVFYPKLCDVLSLNFQLHVKYHFPMYVMYFLFSSWFRFWICVFCKKWAYGLVVYRFNIWNRCGLVSYHSCSLMKIKMRPDWVHEKKDVVQHKLVMFEWFFLLVIFWSCVILLSYDFVLRNLWIAKSKLSFNIGNGSYPVVA